LWVWPEARDGGLRLLNPFSMQIFSNAWAPLSVRRIKARLESIALAIERWLPPADHPGVTVLIRLPGRHAKFAAPASWPTNQSQLSGNFALAQTRSAKGEHRLHEDFVVPLKFCLEGQPVPV